MNEQDDLYEEETRFLDHYPSWEAFEQHFNQIRDEFCHELRFRTSTKIKQHNDKLKQEKFKKAEFLVYHSRTLMCTHGIQHQQRGTGKRTSRSTRFTGCPAKVFAVSKQISSNEYIVVVTQKLVHNHAIGKNMVNGDNKSVKASSRKSTPFGLDDTPDLVVDDVHEALNKRKHADERVVDQLDLLNQEGLRKYLRSTISELTQVHQLVGQVLQRNLVILKELDEATPLENDPDLAVADIPEPETQDMSPPKPPNVSQGRNVRIRRV